MYFLCKNEYRISEYVERRGLRWKGRNAPSQDIIHIDMEMSK
jgi:hypothetical protein